MASTNRATFASLYGGYVPKLVTSKAFEGEGVGAVFCACRRQTGVEAKAPHVRLAKGSRRGAKGWHGTRERWWRAGDPKRALRPYVPLSPTVSPVKLPCSRRPTATGATTPRAKRVRHSIVIRIIAVGNLRKVKGGMNCLTRRCREKNALSKRKIRRMRKVHVSGQHGGAER